MPASTSDTYDAVLLDFYGTLARAVSWGPSLGDVLDRHGYTPPADSGFWRSATADGSDHLEHSTSRDAYVAWERARLGEYAKQAGVPDDAIPAVVPDLYEAAKTFELEVFPETIEVLDSLRRRGVRLAVCSNWDWDLPELLADLDLLGHFDLIVTSARAGARKPHPRIYRRTLDPLDADPARTLFVGDSWEPDVVGPVAFGMDALHVLRGDGEPLPLPDGAYRAPDLTALTALVD